MEVIQSVNREIYQDEESSQNSIKFNKIQKSTKQQQSEVILRANELKISNKIGQKQTTVSNRSNQFQILDQDIKQCRFQQGFDISKLYKSNVIPKLTTFDSKKFISQNIKQLFEEKMYCEIIRGLNHSKKRLQKFYNTYYEQGQQQKYFSDLKKIFQALKVKQSENNSKDDLSQQRWYLCNLNNQCSVKVRDFCDQINEKIERQKKIHSDVPVLAMKGHLVLIIWKQLQKLKIKCQKCLNSTIDQDKIDIQCLINDFEEKLLCIQPIRQAKIQTKVQKPIQQIEQLPIQKRETQSCWTWIKKCLKIQNKVTFEQSDQHVQSKRINQNSSKSNYLFKQNKAKENNSYMNLNNELKNTPTTTKNDIKRRNAIQMKPEDLQELNNFQKK